MPKGDGYEPPELRGGAMRPDGADDDSDVDDGTLNWCRDDVPPAFPPKVTLPHGAEPWAMRPFKPLHRRRDDLGE